MTISASEPLKSSLFTGTGFETTFPFYFTVYRPEEVTVMYRPSTGAPWVALAYGSGYTVSINPNAPGGNVNLAAPLASGAQLVSFVDTFASQDRSYSNQSGMFVNEIEKSVDKLTSMARQLNDMARRAPLVPRVTDTRDLTLPVPSSGRVLLATADGWVNGPTGTEIANAQAAAESVTEIWAEINGDGSDFEQHYLDGKGPTP